MGNEKLRRGDFGSVDFPPTVLKRDVNCGVVDYVISANDSAHGNGGNFGTCKLIKPTGIGEGGMKPIFVSLCPLRLACDYWGFQVLRIEDKEQFIRRECILIL
jgi:hypothetical protein